MMYLFITLLPGLLVAALEKRSIEIHENGAVYHQTVTFDFERKVQTIHVPAHNDIVESTHIFDFKNGVFIESQPKDERCYLKEIPSTMATMEQNYRAFSKRMAPVDASKALVLPKHFMTTLELSLEDLDLEEMKEHCYGHKIFMVEEVDPEDNRIRKTSFTPAPSNPLLRYDTCKFSSECLWQTCYFGTDSCYWTANCPTSDHECNEMIHNHDFNQNDTPMHCNACFNIFCTEEPNCAKEYHENCSDGADFGGAVPACKNDEDIGNDCGLNRCPLPSDKDNFNGGKGTFDCINDRDRGYVLENHLCIFTCGETGKPGGFIQCRKDRTYDDMTEC